jgi:hypothetical protein
MPFLTRVDYGTAIQNNILDAIIATDSTIIDAAEIQAIEEMRGYLNSRYDVAAIFAATGSDRNPLIVMYVVAIALYNVHHRINPRKVPSHREAEYMRAKDWMMAVAEGLINPPDLPRPTGSEKDYFRFGGNTRRDNQF